MPLGMRYSKAGLLLTERFEQCRRVAYWDALGKVWTIGWGHTGPEVVEGLEWTQEQCDAQVDIDDAKAVACVNRVVTVCLSQGEFDALVDFAFNCGDGNFEGSTLLRLLNQGDYSGAAIEFDKWDHAGGKEVAGLLRRREAETQEFLGVNA